MTGQSGLFLPQLSAVTACTQTEELLWPRNSAALLAAAAALAPTAAAIGGPLDVHRHTCKARRPCAQSRAAGTSHSRRRSAGLWGDMAAISHGRLLCWELVHLSTDDVSKVRILGSCVDISKVFLLIGACLYACALSAPRSSNFGTVSFQTDQARRPWITHVITV